MGQFVPASVLASGTEIQRGEGMTKKKRKTDTCKEPGMKK
jgi:hypothetical protein